jgi:hypothetical protein
MLEHDNIAENGNIEDPSVPKVSERIGVTLLKVPKQKPAGPIMVLDRGAARKKDNLTIQAQEQAAQTARLTLFKFKKVSSDGNMPGLKASPKRHSRPKTESQTARVPEEKKYGDHLLEDARVGFLKTINKHNRYYLNFIAEPKELFKSMKDLEVNLKTQVTQQPTPDPLHHRGSSAHRKSITKPRASKLRSMGSTTDFREFLQAQTSPKESVIKNRSMSQYNLMVSCNEKYQENWEDLEKIGEQMVVHGELNEDEKEFFKMVKANDEHEVSKKLSFKKNYVHLKDNVNKLIFIVITIDQPNPDALGG